jgi:hypothetical protein
MDKDDVENLIIVDIDDTCLDTVSGFIKWLSKHNRLGKVTGSAITSRNLLGDWLGVSDDLATHWMRDFCERSWEWGALYPTKEAQPAIADLYNSDWNFIAVSRGASTIDRGTLRRANLELMFPGIFEELYTMPMGANVYPLIKDYAPSICITADIAVAVASAEAGHITYLIDQPWNREYNNLSVRRFNNWSEILKALDDLQQNFV